MNSAKTILALAAIQTVTEAFRLDALTNQTNER